jgi:hypothetical protein
VLGIGELLGISGTLILSYLNTTLLKESTVMSESVEERSKEEEEK